MGSYWTSASWSHWILPGLSSPRRFGLNNEGQVVGQWMDGGNNTHGFVWTAQNGFVTVDAPQGVGTTIDVLVMDISMPGMDGLQAASKICRGTCRTKVVFLTVHEDQDYVDAAFAAGASGYVSKSHVTSDLVNAIREALNGRTFISKFGKT